MPDYVEGVANLRGSIIPIVNLRKLFAIEPKPLDADTRTIVVNVGKRTIGCTVDTVTQVVRISQDAACRSRNGDGARCQLHIWSRSSPGSVDRTSRSRGAIGSSSEYREFWYELGQGISKVARYKRFGKGGREVYLQVSKFRMALHLRLPPKMNTLSGLAA